jgi:hypothetical protein
MLYSSYLNGKHHYDEICTRFGWSCSELDEQLGGMGVAFVYK